MFDWVVNTPVSRLMKIDREIKGQFLESFYKEELPLKEVKICTSYNTFFFKSLVFLGSASVFLNFSNFSLCYVYNMFEIIESVAIVMT